ncbi:hypothetical protein FNV43_RR13669 [Rhamnella rubrinervis]|uniref:FHA domain-containing protein n=1 Tax=Rhamnella rubrinervis TaxID=2594499 RepID=A0A8K0H1K6_9ROSA|nr:hypothetical protein FNV43_RR13669 [Rhamnella rubrinervis]
MTAEMDPPAPPPPRIPKPPTDPLPQTLDDDGEPPSSSSSVITFKTPMPPPSPPPSNSQSLSDTDPPQSDDSAAEEQLQWSSTDSDAGVGPAESSATTKEAVRQSQGIVVPYTIPPWSGAPSHQFSLEVLKDGSIIDQLDVYAKGAYMFGRVDLCDFALDHPTISRFHAVLQFKRSGDAYIYDLGSTHGTFINKNQVKKKVYVDLHVGDVIRFGHSSRLYIFQGPSELMPPEKDLKTIRKTKMYEEIQDREASLQRARREASLAEGISWGMGEDAIEEAEDDIDEVTWQTYRGQLTEKQEKTREKVIKRMEKIAHMKKEIDAIRVKDISQGGLTQGQQTQIARNEQRITQIVEELENLEETLNESIRESIGARSGKQSRGKKKGATEDDEELSSDDDEFYDRTKKKSSSKKAGENQSIETADTLLDKKDDIMKEIEDKKELLLDEKNKMTSETTEETKMGDELDAYMSGLSSQLVLDKTRQLEKEISALQSELDRILYLLKIADPTGEATKKRSLKIADQVGEAAKEKELRLRETKPSKSEIPTTIKKQPPVEPKENSETEKPENGFMQKEGSIDTTVKLSNKPEAGENTLDTAEGKTSVPVYVVAKPQWLGAVEKREKEESNQQVATSDAHGSDEFVDYKDRKKILASSDGTRIKMESDIENATPGLIIRKRKQVHEFEGNDIDAYQESTSSSTASGFMAEDAVSLLLKHKKGYRALDEDNNTEGVDVLNGHELSKEKKPKRVLGPEKPSFLEANSDYETWVPPQGQSGDGRTSLNDRFGY